MPLSDPSSLKIGWALGGVCVNAFRMPGRAVRIGARIIPLGHQRRDVEADDELLGDVYIDVAPERIILVVGVGLIGVGVLVHVVETRIVHVSYGGVVAHALRAAPHAYVVTLHDGGFFHESVHPVYVGIVVGVVAAEVGVERILVVFGRSAVVDRSFVVETCVVIRSEVFRQARRSLKTYPGVDAHRQGLYAAVLGRDQHHAVRSPQAVEGGRRGVFEDRNRFDVGREMRLASLRT